jgi:hypothetical protein
MPKAIAERISGGPPPRPGGRPPPPPPPPQRQARRGNGDRHAGGDEIAVMDHERAGAERAHADVMHGENAAAHQARRQGQAQQGQRPGARGIHRGAHHDDANQKRQQRRKHQVIDLERHARRQHADEMHGPDRNRQRECRAGQQQAPPHAARPPDLHRQTQAHIGALDRHHDREQDKPGLISHWHCRCSFTRTRRFKPIRQWVLGAIIDEFAAGATPVPSAS